jgi:hypothetical protein
VDRVDTIFVHEPTLTRVHTNRYAAGATGVSCPGAASATDGHDTPAEIRVYAQ